MQKHLNIYNFKSTLSVDIKIPFWISWKCYMSIICNHNICIFKFIFRIKLVLKWISSYRNYIL